MPNIPKIVAGPDVVLSHSSSTTTANQNTPNEITHKTETEGVVGFAKSVNGYFESQSGLANFLQIGGASIGVGIFVWKIIRIFSERRHKFDSVQDWIISKIGESSEHLTSHERGQVSLAIVDDQMSDHPVSYLKKIGFKPKTFKKFSLARVDELRAFDAIILDVANVIVEDMQRGGLEMIKRLKDRSAAPIVIAVSGKQYDPTVHQYFVLADAVLDKPISEVEIESALTQLLDQRLSLAGLAATIDKRIQQAFPAAPVKASRSIISALKRHTFSEATIAGALELHKEELETLILRLKGKLKNA